MVKEGHAEGDYKKSEHAEEMGCFEKNCWTGNRKWAFIAVCVAVVCAILIPVLAGGSDDVEVPAIDIDVTDVTDATDGTTAVEDGEDAAAPVVDEPVADVEAPVAADDTTADAPVVADDTTADAPVVADDTTADAPVVADDTTADAPVVADEPVVADNTAATTPAATTPVVADNTAAASTDAAVAALIIRLDAMEDLMADSLAAANDLVSDMVTDEFCEIGSLCKGEVDGIATCVECSGSSWWLWLIIAVAVVGIAFAVWFFVFKKKADC
jgi:hypothetical protein